MKLTNKDILLFSGDSITDGARGRKMDCNHIMGHGYQTIVAGALALENMGSMPKFINKGYSGATINQLLSTWQEDVIDNKPTILSLLIGTNDATQGYLNGLSPIETCEKYRTGVQSAIDRTRTALGDIPIILCEPFYFPLDRTTLTYDHTPHPYCEAPFARPDRDDTDELVQFRCETMLLLQSASEHIADENHCTFVPLRKRFEDAMAQSRREYFMWDGTHPSIAGHALIAKAWLEETE